MKELKLPRIDQKKCVLCGDCVESCPHQVLAMADGRIIFANPHDCVYCATCESVCPQEAILCDFEILWA